MNLRDRRQELLAAVASGFVSRMTELIPSNSTDSEIHTTPQQLGALIADMLADAVSECLQTQRPVTAKSPRSDPVYTDHEILAQRMAVWNHKHPRTPELLHALAHYDRLCFKNSKGPST